MPCYALVCGPKQSVKPRWVPATIVRVCHNNNNNDNELFSRIVFAMFALIIIVVIYYQACQRVV